MASTLVLCQLAAVTGFVEQGVLTANLSVGTLSTAKSTHLRWCRGYGPTCGSLRRAMCSRLGNDRDIMDKLSRLEN